MDGLRLFVAFAPLACYLLLIGTINLARRPVLLSGAMDTLALGLGISGLVLVGPIELLHPPALVNHIQGFVWILSAGVYALALSLVVLLGRPRLVVYNIAADDFHPLLDSVALDLDPQRRWAGNCLALPALRVVLHVDYNAAMRNVSLSSVGEAQSYSGWKRLERGLTARLAPMRVAPSAWGATILLAAILLLATALWQAGQQEVMAALRNVLPL